VFDWGEMPDQLNGKGIALAQFTKSIYKYLENKNIKTHRLNDPCADNEMLIKPFKVLRGNQILPNEENLFIPLEVIFRLGVAKGSSLLKRETHYKEYERFETPMIEFTTKLERFDRPLTHSEAKALSAMNDSEWEEILKTTTNIAKMLESLFIEHGIVLWDGKIEFAFGTFKDLGREIILVDTIGPDELRLSKDGVLLSKEVIRQFYRTSEWYKKLDKVKADFGEDFKNHMSPPPALSGEFKKSVEEMYTLLALVIEGGNEGAPKLKQLLPKLKGTM
jgi:phosphoribosylaminoimidazole-succinocarboxamide synthase